LPNKKIVTLFVEGPTEIEFYKAIIKYAHDVMGAPFNCSFELIDMQGIGNFKDNALRKFKALRKKHPNDDFYALLCIDTDVFQFSKKPPINKTTVKKSIENAGAQKVYYIEAKLSIEDWFLADFDGVISYLGLPKNTKRPKGKGQEVLKKLFMDAKRVYVKGHNTENFIKALDIGKIMKANCDPLKILCRIAGLDCKSICDKDHFFIEAQFTLGKKIAFSAPSYFSDAFRKEYGISPTEYRGKR